MRIEVLVFCRLNGVLKICRDVGEGDQRAPLNEEFGKAVGADAYCRDAAIAVETAKSLLAARRAAKGGARSASAA